MDKSYMVERLINHFSNGSKSAFAERLGVKPQTVHSWISRNTFDAELIFAKCENVSPEWLLTGKGDMVTQETNSEIFTPINTSKITESIPDQQLVPLYSIEATAGIFEQSDNVEYITGHIAIPGMPKCDGALHVTGYSMQPLLESGDIVAVKRVYDMSNIHYGDMYLISINEDGDTYTAVKWIHKHPSDDSKIILVSNNEHYPPREVLKKYVTSLSLVKVCIRFNTME